jgi:hypothetical protein
MAAVADRFQSPDFVKAMEEGGFTYLCTAVQDNTAGDFPAGRYSVHLFRDRGALPGSLGLAEPMPLETSLYSLAFKDMGPLAPKAGSLAGGGLDLESIQRCFSALEEKPRSSGTYGD